MTRQEHINWAKGRALAFCDNNDPRQAISSLLLDLRKHNELLEHPAIKLGARLMFSGQLASVPQVRSFIEGVA